MVRLIAALLGILSWGFAAFFSIRYPLPDSLGQGSFNPAWNWGWGLVVVGILLWSAWIGYSPTGKKEPRRFTYGLRILASLTIQLVLAFLASTYLHRDFLTIVFQDIAIHYALFLDAAPRYKSRIYLMFSDRLFAFTLAIVAFFLVWIALMGYGIMSRSEPRWIPSIGYNVLNLGICCFIGIANLYLKTGYRREVSVSGDGLFLDNLDILPLISPAARPLASYFILHAGGKALVCHDAQTLMGSAECDLDCGKATTCAGYRYLYNRVHEVRKVFAALKIGSICAPENRKVILEQGWIFVPDASIRITRSGEGHLYQVPRPSLL